MKTYNFRNVTGNPDKITIIELKDGNNSWAYRLSDGSFVTYGGQNFTADRRFKLVKGKAKQIKL